MALPMIFGIAVAVGAVLLKAGKNMGQNVAKNAKQFRPKINEDFKGTFTFKGPKGTATREYVPAGTESNGSGNTVYSVWDNDKDKGYRTQPQLYEEFMKLNDAGVKIKKEKER